MTETEILTIELAPKKSVKMDLGSFLTDNSIGGSWADEEVDMSSIGVPITGSQASTSVRREGTYQPQGGFRDNEERRERKEFPIPDQPPYRARVANLPWDVEEQDLGRFFEDRMQVQDAISDIKLPVDNMTGKLKGFGFVTFAERALLEEALNLNMADLNGRKIFVNVAAPQRADVFDMDWRSARSGPMEGGRPPREEVEIDWSSARSSGGLPPRENRGDRGERRPRREEPEIDWSSARSSGGLPPRENRGERGERGERSERRPRREEPDLDWGAVRSSAGTLPPREKSGRGERSERRPKKDEPEFDWSAARSSVSTLPPRERSARTERPDRKQEPALDWKRGQALDSRSNSKTSKANKKVDNEKKDNQPKPQKSSFDVLTVESDDEETQPEKEVEEPKAEQATTGLEEETSKLSVNNKEGEGWEVVGK
ncbi:uncharacterized protein AC631_02516 [Debaryomyces fabryi]|uniref:RRM domain-containing protein n=1 Tax=Debaryomyces fabryi TaxID=58627 RepID=A0A0V1Q009_9ASCO|nr:uncharacterized protein AC631_02516 [Debaryomyces fabryi]KSA01708.1 hypothetical protein AC631_02516 [Debaryomyces fabryi]CUM45255.1 unnamed protein product [Debaryomyces fabryi]